MLAISSRRTRLLSAGNPARRGISQMPKFAGNRPNNKVTTAAMPMAYASHIRPRFNIMRPSGDVVRVSGCDLVQPIPNEVASIDNQYKIFALIPSNPSYWKGTRIAQFAPAYQNFRPISLTFSYIPQVAVTTPGTVIMGTMWNSSGLPDALQQSLLTSNGGCMTQCYVPAETTIALGTNLQQNLFTTYGSLNPDTSPFTFIALMAGSDVVPGYFYVSYTYDFKNPIGSMNSYNLQIGRLSDMLNTRTNEDATLIPLQPCLTKVLKLGSSLLTALLGSSASSATIPAGAQLDLESDFTTTSQNIVSRPMYNFSNSDFIRSLVYLGSKVLPTLSYDSVQKTIQALVAGGMSQSEAEKVGNPYVMKLTATKTSPLVEDADDNSSQVQVTTSNDPNPISSWTPVASGQAFGNNVVALNITYPKVDSVSVGTTVKIFQLGSNTLTADNYGSWYKYNIIDAGYPNAVSVVNSSGQRTFNIMLQEETSAPSLIGLKGTTIDLPLTDHPVFGI